MSDWSADGLAMLEEERSIESTTGRRRRSVPAPGPSSRSPLFFDLDEDPDRRLVDRHDHVLVREPSRHFS
jgi:hypothetical protein